MITSIKAPFSVEEQEVLYRAEEILRSRVLNTLFTVSEPIAVVRYLRMKLAPLQREAFGLLHLDNQHRIVGDQILFYGTIDASPVYPREVVKSVLGFNSAAVIFYHNHPSGIAEPSQADRAITEKLKSALNVVDVRVLDHFVIGDTHVSFAERGLI
jgi:DNA repair protein RadC